VCFVCKKQSKTSLLATPPPPTLHAQTHLRNSTALNSRASPSFRAASATARARSASLLARSPVTAASEASTDAFHARARAAPRSLQWTSTWWEFAKGVSRVWCVAVWVVLLERT
jgi:hypothetical protein